MIVARLDGGRRKKRVDSANFVMRLGQHLASLKLVTKDYGKHYDERFGCSVERDQRASRFIFPL